MTWEELIEICRTDYSLKEVTWIKNINYPYLGECDYINGIVKLSYFHLKNDLELKITTLFHELGHIHCYKNKLWEKYHGEINDIDFIRKMGLKVERWVEKWAEREMKKYFPELKYRNTYFNKDAKKDYQKTFLASLG